MALCMAALTWLQCFLLQMIVRGSFATPSHLLRSGHLVGEHHNTRPAYLRLLARARLLFIVVRTILPYAPASLEQLAL